MKIIMIIQKFQNVILVLFSYIISCSDAKRLLQISGSREYSGLRNPWDFRLLGNVKKCYTVSVNFPTKPAAPHYISCSDATTLLKISGHRESSGINNPWKFQIFWACNTKVVCLVHTQEKREYKKL